MDRYVLTIEAAIFADNQKEADKVLRKTVDELEGVSGDEVLYFYKLVEPITQWDQRMEMGEYDD